MSTVKDSVLKLAESLPDDCTWEDVRYQLYARMKVEEGLAAIERGEVASHEEVLARVKLWSASSGQSPQSPT